MKKTKWIPVLFGMVLVAGLTMIRAHDGFVSQTIRNLTFDQYQRLLPRKIDNTLPVRVIDIDEASLAQLGQFPWPRTYMATLVDNLQSAGAAAIAFDIIFAEPDRLSPSRIVGRKAIRQWLERTRPDGSLSGLPDNDKIFAKSIARAPVVLAIGRSDAHPLAEPEQKSGYAFTGTATLEALHNIGQVTPIHGVLEKAASGTGIISVSPNDNQEVVRKYPLVWSRKNKAFPSLALEALRVAQNETTIIVRGAETESGAVEKISVGTITASTSRKGELWMYYAHNNRALYLSAHQVIKADKKKLAGLRKKIAGHIVFIGASAAGLFDVKTTALGETLPGVAVHAQAVQQILSQTFLLRPDWFDGAEILVICLVGLFIIFATVFLTPSWSLAVGLFISAILAAVSWLGFARYGLLIDASFSIFSGLIVLFAMTAYRFLITDREARFVRLAFSRYVSPDVLRDIQNHPETLMLGGDTRIMTIMFMDIRNFTPLSETLTPHELVTFLNRLLGELSGCVIRYGGTIDKYIGDSIMAFWNAPVEAENHHEQACLAALDMRETINRLNADDAFGFKAKGYEFAEIAIGVGINSGSACVGNLGSDERFDYSVVGDTVNVAARAEASCKQLGADIVITASTAEAVGGKLALLDAGSIALKGVTGAQQVYVLVGNGDVAKSIGFKKLQGICHDLSTSPGVDKTSGQLEKAVALAAKISPNLSAFCKKLGEQRLSNNAPD